MTVFAREANGPISDDAKTHRASLQPYPVLDVWMNPVTRGLARKLTKQDLAKSLKEIDFEYRLQDDTIGGVACTRMETATPAKKDLYLIYVHGGALGNGSPESTAAIALPICRRTGAQTIGINYTSLPEGRFPDQMDDIDAVHDAILSQNDKARIFFIADGIGACFTLSCMLRRRDEGKKLPAGAIFLSGMFDGAGHSDTLKTLDGHDPLIRAQGGKQGRKLFRYYAPGRKLNDPAVSPVYGNFAGLPPILAHVGSREVLLGDTARMMEAARRAGVVTHLRVFDGMFHQFHMHWRLPETRAAHEDIGDFISALEWS